ncbi:MAG: MBL fold metallo-hydrolase [Myxococcota bacterium]|nr:MBL fold metallo-hydrolase [Myxococcota bacterium]
MNVRHLNCASLCPRGWRLIDGETAGMVCHCLLIETEGGLVLVDTGLGRQIVQQRQAAVGQIFHATARPRYDMAETAWQQIRRLGYAIDDVRHIVLTHLDVDHAGGLRDFPKARVHVHRAEFNEARHPTGVQGRRYLKWLWDAVDDWSTYEETGEKWFGFDAVRSLQGLSPEILLIPLFGHSRGHCGVAVQTEHGWLFHGGDAYFHRHEIGPKPTCPLPLRLQQRTIAYDDKTRCLNRDRLRKLALEHADTVTVFCSHDAVDLAQCQHGHYGHHCG